MALWTDAIEPAELTGYARQTQEDYEAAQGTLARFLPNRLENDIVARFNRGGGGLGDTAEFRSYDAETTPGDTEGTERVTLELPPLGRKFRNGEYDSLRARGDVSDDAVVPTLEKLAARASRSVADRVEAIRGQVIDTAGININENKFIQRADFERRPDFTVTAANIWSSADADPLADIETWRAAYVEENGEEPGTLLTSTRVLNAALRAKAVRDLVSTGQAVPGVVTREQFNGVLASFGLPVISLYDRRVRKAGVLTRVTPDDKVYLLPAETGTDNPDGTDLGATVWGTTLEASEPEYGIALEDRPGIVVGAYKTLDPIGVWVHAAAIALPVLANPNLSLAAKVL